MVEVKDVDINEKNEFDAIPLFYACLCGHKGFFIIYLFIFFNFYFIELVEYFLNKGAILDPNTYEGWRCYYAALTDEIHEILKNYKGSYILIIIHDNNVY